MRRGSRSGKHASVASEHIDSPAAIHDRALQDRSVVMGVTARHQMDVAVADIAGYRECSVGANRSFGLLDRSELFEPIGLALDAVGHGRPQLSLGFTLERKPGREALVRGHALA
jgi:hypothetical protein